MSCVLKTIVVPRRRSSSTASRSTSALTGSRPENGSSRITSLGRATTVAMNCTFCDMPFESASTFWSRHVGEVEPLEPAVDLALDVGAPARPSAAP